MSSRSGSPIATLFMFVPLVAVPLMAVFGVPKFPALNASPTGESDDDFLTEPDWQHDDSISTASDDVFAPAESRGNGVEPPPFNNDGAHAYAMGRVEQTVREDPFASQTADSTTTPNWDPPSGSLDGWALDDGAAQSQTADATSEQQPLRDSASADLGDSAEFADSRAEGAPAAEGDALTWQSAVRRLQDFGVDDFQLRPGSAPDQFHFSCMVQPAENSPVVHRFEAEAAEPLDAVQDVMTQLESWLAKQ